MYLLRHIAATGWFDVLCNRATIAHLTGEKLAAILIPTPPLPEQRAIADFLDRKTQAIDALIQKKERLIVLLQEKRQALITQAVTKGLDPSVPMKDSGIEWLGEIPVHWDLIALRRFATFQRGHDLPQSSREEGRIPVVSSAGVSGTHCIAAAIGPGIVTGRYGSIGQFHYVETDYWPLNTALYTRDLHGNWPQFIFYALSVLSPLFVMESNKSAVPGVDRNDLHGYKIAVPPVQEQRQIATFLETATSELDQLVEKTQTSADRLREYRQALISAAVTGKIDVTKETI